MLNNTLLDSLTGDKKMANSETRFQTRKPYKDPSREESKKAAKDILGYIKYKEKVLPFNLKKYPQDAYEWAMIAFELDLGNDHVAQEELKKLLGLPSIRYIPETKNSGYLDFSHGR